MVVLTVWTVLCTTAIAFYLRFLVALCKECKPSLIGYWARLRSGSGEDDLAEHRARATSVTRAA
jgi:hypothetical protein